MSALATLADVGRFFRKAPEEVERMVAEDMLPALMLPGPSKTGHRFTLPDLHAWLVKRLPGESQLHNYERFKAEFYGAQPERKRATRTR